MILWQKMQTEERQNTKSLKENWIYLQKLNYMNTTKITEKEFNEAQQQLLNIPVVMQQSGQLFCSMAGKGFCPYEYENGKCNVQ